MNKILLRAVTSVLLLSMLTGCGINSHGGDESFSESYGESVLENNTESETVKNTDKKEDEDMPEEEKSRKTPIMGWASWNA